MPNRYLAALFLLLLTSNAALATFETSITSENIKIRPWDAAPRTKTHTIDAVKGEWVATQIITRTQDRSTSGIDITATPPQRKNDYLPSLSFYKEYNHDLMYASRVAGGAGEWPDALIPKKDPYYHEERNAFPYDVKLVSKAYNVWGYNLTGQWKINRRNSAQHPPQPLGEYTGNEARVYHIKITQPGQAGLAQFVWSDDDGATWSPPQTVPASPTETIPLSNGISVQFPVQTKDYATDDEYEFFANTYRNDVIWAETFIPEDTAPGTYTSTITVTADNQPPQTLNLTIIVHDITIPRTSSIPVWYLASRNSISAGHAQQINPGGDWEALFDDYLEEGLKHRITLDGLYPFLSWNGTDITNWDVFAAKARPYLNGQWSYGAKASFLQLPRAPPHDSFFNLIFKETIKEYDLKEYRLDITRENYSLPFIMGERVTLQNGASFRNLHESQPYFADEVDGVLKPGTNMTGTQSNATATLTAATPSETFYLDKLDNLLAQEGWLDKTYNYMIEEPTWPNEYSSTNYTDTPAPQTMTDAIRQTSTSMKAINPEFKNFAVEIYQEEWEDAIDVWVPSIAGCGRTGYVDCYASRDKQDIVQWSYAACGTHHCYRTGDDTFTKLPTHIIDANFTNLRGMYWLKYNGNITGDLYWRVDYQFVFAGHSTPIDPWENIWFAGGNGDGTLFYPGRPNIVGGTHHIPISSLRVKAIREGLEDYELFALATQRGLRSDVLDAIKDAVGTDWYAYTTLPTPAAMDHARKEVITLLEGTCYTPARAGDVDCNSEVNIYDLTLVGSSFGTTPQSPDWNRKGKRANACSTTELSPRVGVEDLNCVSQNFGNAD
ncbi:DUF4091 domain-containing protein [Candidatus Woesearchaeota archaeon]|nr:MAG: DUF4091 domain-containing protein [Candidatus Woesearchaeota archaeon]